MRTLRWLTRRGASVFEASSVPAACEMVADRSVHVDIVLTDLLMPGLSGARLIEFVRLNRPETPVIVVSAAPECGLRPEPDLVLTKPTSCDALRDAIASIMRRSAGQAPPLVR